MSAGAIPSSLATNTNLETLDVKGNHLSILPVEWIVGYPQVANSSLVNVRFSFNNFTGPFPAALAQAPQLTFLVINNNTLRCPSLLSFLPQALALPACAKLCTPFGLLGKENGS